MFSNLIPSSHSLLKYLKMGQSITDEDGVEIKPEDVSVTTNGFNNILGNFSLKIELSN